MSEMTEEDKKLLNNLYEKLQEVNYLLGKCATSNIQVDLDIMNMTTMFDIATRNRIEFEAYKKTFYHRPGIYKLKDE